MAQGRGLDHRGCGADQVTSTSGNTVTSLLFRPTISGKNSSTLVYSQALPDSRTERNFVREESADHRFQHPLVSKARWTITSCSPSVSPVPDFMNHPTLEASLIKPATPATFNSVKITLTDCLLIEN
ncbi:hypothetical protein B0H13DRAFT_1875487 [Mycena leptocephala]|nr:hypothetical protein B0H13DRAFT_1875487 [Mycena leptocephala]